MSITTDRTIYNNRPDIVMFDKTIKAAHSVDVAIPNNYNLHRFHKNTDLKVQLMRIW